jgi:hypothetical protein
MRITSVKQKLEENLGERKGESMQNKNEMYFLLVF